MRRGQVGSEHNMQFSVPCACGERKKIDIGSFDVTSIVPLSPSMDILMCGRKKSIGEAFVGGKRKMGLCGKERQLQWEKKSRGEVKACWYGRC